MKSAFPRPENYWSNTQIGQSINPTERFIRENDIIAMALFEYLTRGKDRRQKNIKTHSRNHHHVIDTDDDTREKKIRQKTIESIHITIELKPQLAGVRDSHMTSLAPSGTAQPTWRK